MPVRSSPNGSVFLRRLRFDEGLKTMFPAQLIPVSLLVAWKHQYYPYLRAIRIKGLYGTHQYRLSPIGRNCLGSSHPMRKPLPPATIRTYFIGFTQPLHNLQSDNHRLFQFGNFILALQQFHYRQSKLHGSARTFSCNDIAVFSTIAPVQSAPSRYCSKPG